ncbi:MAG: division plane positioning ATPase MipZ [Holosporaceae bacterium]|jgi:chromosome partitioning protein|nr:division plane positioning ATPase MipZ [Holosporaceae bacterium]
MKPYVIVLGNEKGGTGKSTVAMNIAACLLNAGFKVGTVDADARQGTFTKYFEYRKNAGVIMPEHISLPLNNDNDREKAHAVDTESFNNAMIKLADGDFIVIDTPGNDTCLSRLAHSHADTLLTPLNDSFVDLDVLANVSGQNMQTLRPSIYAEMVWNQRKERAKRGEKPIDWIVIRNRLTTLYTKNRRDINVVLEALSGRMGFRLGVGFCDRVIFKELFLSGLTLSDLEKSDVSLSISHISARQELRELINFMKLPNL